MTGRLSGLITRTKEVAPESKYMHCAIHKQMLASRKMLLEFTSVLNDVVKVINCIKAHAHSSSLPRQLCEEMDVEHRRLRLYTEVRRLSGGTSLIRVYELREQLQRFLSKNMSSLASHVSDKVWVT